MTLIISALKVKETRLRSPPKTRKLVSLGDVFKKLGLLQSSPHPQ